MGRILRTKEAVLGSSPVKLADGQTGDLRAGSPEDLVSVDLQGRAVLLDGETGGGRQDEPDRPDHPTLKVKGPEVGRIFVKPIGLQPLGVIGFFDEVAFPAVNLEPQSVGFLKVAGRGKFPEGEFFIHGRFRGTKMQNHLFADSAEITDYRQKKGMSKEKANRS
jgi:hypothetical protein